MNGRALISKMLPSKVKGVADYYRFPSIMGFSPLNGQCGRQQLFIDLVRTVQFTRIVETGTFRGTTTEYFARESGLPVYSVETEPRYYHYAKHRLRNRKDVFLSLGDSRQFLRRVLAGSRERAEKLFIYLDAHWYADLPLSEEVEIITSAVKDYLIMIDDFCVPGDTGYGFDSYGPEKTLDIEYLRGAVEKAGCDIAFPTLPSYRESGVKRGCIVLSSPSLRPALRDIAALRTYEIAFIS
jgi:hypothetical protein